jgi:hypothetical protein
MGLFFLVLVGILSPVIDAGRRTGAARVAHRCSGVYRVRQDAGLERLRYGG